MILVPTRGRPENIKRLIDGYKATQASLPVTLLLDEDDPFLSDYWKLLQEAPNWYGYVGIETGKGILALINEFFLKNRDLDWYGLLSDDVVPKTLSWDIALRDTCLEYDISWANDSFAKRGGEGAMLACHPFISGRFCRFLNFISYPGFFHGYVDLLWTLAGYMISAAKGYRENVVIEHIQTDSKEYDKNKDRRAYIEILPSYIETVKDYKISKWRLK